MIDSVRKETGYVYSIRQVTSVLGFARSSYYHAANPTPSQINDVTIGELIEEIFRLHRGRYGYRRIRSEMADRDVQCGPDRVRRIMRKRGLRAIQPKSFVPRTSDGRADSPAKNLLLNQSMPKSPNQVLAGDITHIPRKAGWLYLAVVIDLCTRKVVGWALADHMRAELVTQALREALESSEKVPGRIFHSDRGSQYGSRLFRNLLKEEEFEQSMSQRANPYHNAWTESMIGTLKKEMLQGGCFKTEEDARTELFSYLNSYYNNHRKHSSLGYQTPAEFEAQKLSLN